MSLKRLQGQIIGSMYHPMHHLPIRQMKLQIKSHISKMQGDVFVGEAGFTRVQPTNLYYNTTELAWSSLIGGYPPT
jgi:hypothetical protein